METSDEIVWGRQPRRRRPTRLLVAVAAAMALAAIAVAVALHRPHSAHDDRLGPDQVPSLFGYDGPAARQLLEGRGLQVTLQPFRDCEVLGRVVASDPPPGATYRRGDPITVYTSLPADVGCLTDYQDRATAWQFLDFANGRGPAPTFAGRVFVYADGAAPTVLTRGEAASASGWRATGVLRAIRIASDQVALVSDRPLNYALPAIRIIAATDDLGTCGVPDPAVAGSGNAFSVQIRPPEGIGCPVRLDLFRQDRAIEAVALYPAP